MTRISSLKVLVVVLFVIKLCVVSNSGEDLLLHRSKRWIWLYFPNGGGFKIVIGVATPVKLGLKQSMAIGWNLQWQYPGPRTTNDTRTYPPIISKRSTSDGRPSDRFLLYKGVEALLDNSGINGRACLLRAICENAMESTYHEANGLYGRLLHIALTPDSGDGVTTSDLDPEYLDAKRAGEFGVDCTSLYPECYTGSLLEAVSILEQA